MRLATHLRDLFIEKDLHAAFLWELVIVALLEIVKLIFACNEWVGENFVHNLWTVRVVQVLDSSLPTLQFCDFSLPLHVIQVSEDFVCLKSCALSGTFLAISAEDALSSAAHQGACLPSVRVTAGAFPLGDICSWLFPVPEERQLNVLVLFVSLALFRDLVETTKEFATTISIAQSAVDVLIFATNQTYLELFLACI